MNNSDMPAMPQTESSQLYSDTCGLTKREYFAGLAMQAWIQHHGTQGGYSFCAKSCAIDSIECADALLKELDKE